MPEYGCKYSSKFRSNWLISTMNLQVGFGLLKNFGGEGVLRSVFTSRATTARTVSLGALEVLRV